VGWVIGRVFELLVEIEATTGVAPAADPPLNVVALARMLVMRKTREIPLVTGARTGTPNHVTALPFTTPWNTL